MTTQLGGFGIPGQGDAQFATSREILWGGDNRQIGVLWVNALVSGAARDAVNSPTTVLRTGLLLGTITSSKKRIQWDATATDGSQFISGVLDVNGLKTTDFNGTDADRWLRCLVRGPLLARSILIKGAALVGHADEFLARRQLIGAGCIFDDDPYGYLAGKGERVQYKAASFTVLAADNGSTFFVAAGTATLPTIQAGLHYRFVGVADVGWEVKSAEGDNMIVLNDASADTVAFGTGSNKIGAELEVTGAYVNGTLKWITSSGVGTQSLYS